MQAVRDLIRPSIDLLLYAMTLFLFLLPSGGGKKVSECKSKKSSGPPGTSATDHQLESMNRARYERMRTFVYDFIQLLCHTLDYTTLANQ